MEADSSVNQPEPARPSRKPADTAITQQRLPACTPVLDSCWVIFIFVSIGVILIPIGAICFATGIQPVEIPHRYDVTCFKNWTELKTNAERRNRLFQHEEDRTCTVNITVTKKLDPPVYVWYELDGFYQNHRRYVKSRSDAQLAGLTTRAEADCKPQQYYNNNKSEQILPCGLVAWSYFNDTFKINDSRFILENSSIASRTERKRFANTKPQHFNPTENSLRGGGNLTVNVSQDERFILWMKTAALPTFRKLWGKINTPVEANTQLNFQIVNSYNTYDFNGKKKLVIGTTTWLGGNSRFLGLAYLITGATSWVLGVFYAVLLPCIGRKSGQIDNIMWPTPRS